MVVYFYDKWNFGLPVGSNFIARIDPTKTTKVSKRNKQLYVYILLKLPYHEFILHFVIILKGINFKKKMDEEAQAECPY